MGCAVSSRRKEELVSEPEIVEWDKITLPKPNAKKGPESSEELEKGLRAPTKEVNEKVKKLDPVDTVRVFISSTFTDFYSEREYLIKKVFPALREWAAPLGLTVTEVDLRWGIPAESTSSQTVAVCVEEIEKCTEAAGGSDPFFIGLLGGRYGWAPPEEDIPSQVRHHWTPGTSITHLEMKLGAIESSNSRAAFFLRDPKILSEIPGDRIHRFLDSDPDQSEKLKVLKEKIVNSFPARVFNYSASYEGLLNNKDQLKGLEQFGEQVLNTLKQFISMSNRSAADDFEKEERLQRKHMNECGSFFIGRESELRTLSDFAIGKSTDLPILGDNEIENSDPNKNILCVSGSQGIGKSALLANLALQNEDKNGSEKDENLFFSSASASTNSSSVNFLLRRLIKLLSDQDPGPETPIATLTEKLRVALRASEKSHFIIILDGLDQLDSRESAHHLEWLPIEIPSNIRMIVSTWDQDLPTMARLEDRHSLSLPLLPLNAKDQIHFVEAFLDQFGKKLANDHVERLLRVPRSPEWLTAALLELKVCGHFKEIGEKIEQLPLLLEDLFLSILDRVLDESSQTDAAALRKILEILAVVEKGLPENELRELILTNSRDGTETHWLQMLRILKPFLRIMPSGSISLGSPAVNRMVHKKLLSAPSLKRTRHKELAAFFSDSKEYSYFRMSRIPYHLFHSGQYRKLFDFLLQNRSSISYQLGLKRKYLLDIRCNAIIGNEMPSKEAFLCARCVPGGGVLKNNCVLCGTHDSSQHVTGKYCQQHGIGPEKCFLCGTPIHSNLRGSQCFEVKVCTWCRGIGPSHCIAVKKDANTTLE